jgi:(p)ppGpp synthase/HD superfamily hydrolase
VTTNNISKLGIRFQEALIYATQLHANQTRKTSNVPYISHLLSVAALVLEDSGDEDEAIAALLHDAIEDQGGEKTRQEIRQKFGENIAAIVEECTESDIVPKPPWKERKLASIEKFRTVSPQARRVILADKLHNARSLLIDRLRYKEEIWNHFKGGKEGTIWFFRSIIEVERQRGYNPMTEEIDRLIQELEKTY